PLHAILVTCYFFESYPITCHVALCFQHNNISIVVADVTLPESKLSSLLAPHQPFHLLVNNAGVGMLESCLTISEEFDTNLKAPIILAKIVANEMVRHAIRGSIVNISSQASMRPIDHHTVYCASKAGLDMATRCLAKELGSHGIRVNCVNPTVVMTEMGKTVKQVFNTENIFEKPC
ncbi:unnamed protein product, partial [Haemonchus placei]|uniref:DCXR n=1 Tax=Haemonchus placei TaxID=6290 RepID=A0A0N4VT78_HAEPC